MTEGLAREPDPNGGLSETPARRPISSSRLARRLPAWLNLESQTKRNMYPITDRLQEPTGVQIVRCTKTSSPSPFPKGPSQNRRSEIDNELHPR
jgi:hypothetical protein